MYTYENGYNPMGWENADQELILYWNEYGFEKKWNECIDGELMLNLLAKTFPQAISQNTMVKALCAKMVIKHIKDVRSKKAIDAAIEYGKGKIDTEVLCYFFNDAYDAQSNAWNLVRHSKKYWSTPYKFERQKRQSISSNWCFSAIAPLVCEFDCDSHCLSMIKTAMRSKFHDDKVIKDLNKEFAMACRHIFPVSFVKLNEYVTKQKAKDEL